MAEPQGSNTAASKDTATPGLLTFAQLPKWLQDNHFILGNYRGPSYSIQTSVQSILALHTESVNIHTHMWGAAAVLVGAIPVYHSISTPYASFTWLDVAAFGTWFLCAFLCLTLSATYHTICNHSPEVNAVTQKFDHLGIIIMTFGSFLSMIYYGWYCEPALAYTFSTMIITLSIGCAFISSNPRTRTAAWRPYRAAMFICLGLSALVPITSGLRSHGIEGMNSRITLFPWLSLEFACYLLGAILYATRIPERLLPGAFDVFGSSHQIFHVLILCAAGFHLKGLLTTFDWNHQRGVC
ncbi:hypothetical protein QQX98_004057 [Neonectria punicea]|uniref:Uncharacterized protein n=1 Tax=Neonectria punicea TaxID=979145 RepID=A0ABR1HAT6_9HYPO